MVASSFNCLPGLPVLHSRDLVNWRIVAHVFDRLPFPAYDAPAHGCGAWAPSIRYLDGRFWVFFSTPDEGIFMEARPPIPGIVVAPAPGEGSPGLDRSLPVLG